jgi:hypothetical protein
MPQSEVPYFAAYARDKEGCWFFQGNWPYSALHEHGHQQIEFMVLLDTYPEVVCYPVEDAFDRDYAEVVEPFARFVDAQEVVR